MQQPRWMLQPAGIGLANITASGLQGMSSSCRRSHPSLAAPACSGKRRPGPATREPSAIAQQHPGRLSSRALGLRPLRAFRSRRGLLVSERASHEVPGFGAPAPPSA
jgi:hypothetical protein